MSGDTPAPDGWIRRTVRVCNRRGLHARAAAKFVKVAGAFDAEIAVHKNDITVSGVSIMGLMMLAASDGSDLDLAARGPRAGEALDALDALIGGGFDED